MQQPARSDPSTIGKQMSACVGVIPQLRFNKGESECSLKHDSLMYSLHYNINYSRLYTFGNARTVSMQ